jgi:hypothetical protein
MPMTICEMKREQWSSSSSWNMDVYHITIRGSVQQMDRSDPAISGVGFIWPLECSLVEQSAPN